MVLGLLDGKEDPRLALPACEAAEAILKPEGSVAVLADPKEPEPL